MHMLWSEEAEREGTSRVTWEIEAVGDSCRLTVTHDQLTRRRPAGDLRRLADDPVRPEDLAGDRRDPDHPGLAHVRRALTHHTQGGPTMRPTTITDVRTIGVKVTRPGRRHSTSMSTPSASRSGSTPRSARPCAGSRSHHRARPRPSRSTSTPAIRASAADTGIRFTVPDAEAEHAAMRESRRHRRRPAAVGRRSADVHVRRSRRQPLLRRRGRPMSGRLGLLGTRAWSVRRHRRRPALPQLVHGARDGTHKLPVTADRAATAVRHHPATNGSRRYAGSAGGTRSARSPPQDPRRDPDREESGQVAGVLGVDGAMALKTPASARPVW